MNINTDESRSGDNSQPVELPTTIEECYTRLGSVLEKFDTAIPKKGLVFLDQKKKKEFSPDKSVKNIRKSLKDNFPSSEEQLGILQSYYQFVNSIEVNLHPGDKDQAPLGQLDRFLSQFPQNIISRLGDSANSETVAEILNTGTAFVNNYVKGKSAHKDSLGGYYYNHPLGMISILVGQTIPDAVVHAGSNSRGVLEMFKQAIPRLSPSNFSSLVEHYRNITPTPESTIARIARFKERFGTFDQSLNPNNPFEKSDREVWMHDRWMGDEYRKPTWQDVFNMISATEEDDREYGMAITSGTDGNNHIEYLRGARSSIYNGIDTRTSKEVVFFHVHPSSDSDHELTAPLVSSGDIEATSFNDYGGGYLNVFSTSGVTYHIGSCEIPKVGIPRAVVEDSSKLIYTVESGQMKGTRISPRVIREERSEIMRNLAQSRQPYAYSILNRQLGTQLYFVHIPWEQLDKSTDLSSVCFGDGLLRQISCLKDLPSIQIASNLDIAMDQTDSLENQYLENKYRQSGND